MELFHRLACLCIHTVLLHNAAGAWPDESFSLKVGEEHDVHVGDHAITRFSDDYLGDQTLELKVTDISGDTGTDLLTVTCKEVA